MPHLGQTCSPDLSVALLADKYRGLYSLLVLLHEFLEESHRFLELSATDATVSEADVEGSVALQGLSKVLSLANSNSSFAEDEPVHRKRGVVRGP